MVTEKRKAFIINLTYYVLIVALVYIVLKYLLELLFPLIIGLAVAVLLRPVIRFISRKLHLPNKLIAVLIVLLFYSVVGFAVSWLGIRLFTAIKRLVMSLPRTYYATIEPALREIFKGIEIWVAGLDPSLVQTIQELASSLSNSVGTAISNISSTVIQSISGVVSAIPGLLIAIVFSIIFSLFAAVDYERITHYIMTTFPDKGRRVMLAIKRYAIDIAYKYAKGYFLLMFMTFVELSIGLSILKVENPIVIASIIAVIDILPVLGTGGVVIPWLLIELIIGNIPRAIGLGVLYVVITVVRNIMEPKIIGEQLGLHPLIMLACIYIGAKVFGFLGMFALPVSVVMIKHLYDNGKLATSGEDGQTGDDSKPITS